MIHKRKRTGTGSKDIPAMLGGGLYAELIADKTLTLEGFGKMLSYSDRSLTFLLNDRKQLSVEGFDLTVSVLRRDAFRLHGQIRAIRFLPPDGEDARKEEPT